MCTQIYKAKNVMTLTVDGHSSRPYVLVHANNTNTDTPDGVLYLGGVPDDVRAVTKLKSSGMPMGVCVGYVCSQLHWMHASFARRWWRPSATSA
jgi:hypothetical protein